MYKILLKGRNRKILGLEPMLDLEKVVDGLLLEKLEKGQSLWNRQHWFFEVVVGRNPRTGNLHESVNSFKILHAIVSDFCKGYHLHLLAQLLEFFPKPERAHVSELAFLEADDNSDFFCIQGLVD